MMTPVDITKILTAVTPIVTSIASSVASNKTGKIEGNIKPPNINITINNNFYTNSEREAKMIASDIQEQIIDSITPAPIEDENHYIP